MSSYQFVNTLAQCYAEQAGQQSGGGGAGGGQSQDYYNMNYPNCYSPNLNNQHYGQYSMLMTGQAAAAAVAAGAAVADYNSLGGGGGQQGPAPHQMQPPQGQRQSANQSPAGNSSNMAQSIANCKFEMNDSNVGSPQDLRTTSADGTPQLGGLTGPKTPSSPSVSQPPLSPLASSPSSIAAAVAAAAAAQQASSSSSSSQQSSGNAGNNTSSASNNASSGGGGGGKNSSSGKSSSSNGDTPQIYPWMKRVHLGQSKLHFSVRKFLQFVHLKIPWKSGKVCLTKKRLFNPIMDVWCKTPFLWGFLRGFMILKVRENLLLFKFTTKLLFLAEKFDWPFIIIDEFGHLKKSTMRDKSALNFRNYYFQKPILQSFECWVNFWRKICKLKSPFLVNLLKILAIIMKISQENFSNCFGFL